VVAVGVGLTGTGKSVGERSSPSVGEKGHGLESQVQSA
jgi:hypothetical protein